MKNNITKRLISYFLLILLIFSIISGITIYFVAKNSLINNHINELENKIQSISQSLTKALAYEKEMKDMINPSQSKPMRGQGWMKKGNKGLGSNYLKWVGEILQNELTIIYSDEFLSKNPDLSIGHAGSLNPNSSLIVSEALEGKTSSTSWNQEKLTHVLVGTPLLDSQDQQIGLILLEDKMNFSQVIFDTILSNFAVSAIIGAVVAIGLAVFFANKFIRPLKTINESTKKMIGGNYLVDTNVNQKDEIGQVAKNLDELALRLEKSRLETLELDRMRDDFVASMSHELKTPVTVIKSYLEALNSGVVTGEDQVKDYHEILYKESEILERLIFDLMELNILRNQKFKLNKDEINLMDTLKDAIKSQTLMAKSKSISLDSDFSENFIDYQGDYTRLRQMFSTIIDNAIKYSKPSNKVKISQKPYHGKCLISISNFGPEISSETKKNLFEPFFRDKNTKEKGFGLGLAIAKEIANLHGIKLTVESGAGETKFIMEI